MSPVSLQQSTGNHEFSIPSEGLTRGIYYCRITAGKQSETRKVIVLSR